MGMLLNDSRLPKEVGNGMNEPLISVIIPVYNIEKYIYRCIESVVQQDYQNLEIILVDDGSTDTSGAICDQWAERDVRIHVIHQENGGLSFARNQGTKASKGEYLTYVDGDDDISADYVSMLWELTDQGRITVTQCEYGEYVGTELKLHGDQQTQGQSSAREFLLSAHFLVMASGKLIRRAHMIQYQFPVGKIHEDLAIMPRVVYEAGEVAYTCKSMYFYHERPDSINTQSHYYLKHLDMLDFLTANINYFDQRRERELTAKAAREYLYGLLDQYAKVRINYPQERQIIRMLHRKIQMQVVRCLPDQNIHKKTKVLLFFSWINPMIWHRCTN